jgi:hypothetical protein
VWNLSRPNVDDARDDLCEVLETQNQDDASYISSAEIDEVIEIYDRYQEAFGLGEEFLEGLELREDLREAIRESYRQVQIGGKLEKLREKLVLSASECPYCGFGPIEDLDHHLLKTIYKPLSIFALNLVPCCATCNRKKPKSRARLAALRLLHAYLDIVSHVDFFSASAKLDPDTGGVVITFEIRDVSGLDPDIRARLRSQFLLFDLDARLRKQCNILLSSLTVAFSDAFAAGGGPGVSDYLLRTARSTVANFGANDWRTAALIALSENADFCGGGFRRALGERV